MDPRLRTIAREATGFMPEEEGLALYEAGRQAGRGRRDANGGGGVGAHAVASLVARATLKR